jgi:hypothetical protein
MNTMSQLRVGQRRRMGDKTGWTYTVTEISEGYPRFVKLVSEHGTDYEWDARFVESDEIVPVADPKNPQVGDRFSLADWPDRKYKILEVGADTVKVRYYVDVVWDRSCIHRDTPL